VCGIDPVIFATAHDMFLQVGAELEFVDGDLLASQGSAVSAGR
jgi:hypothetical protein